MIERLITLSICSLIGSLILYSANLDVKKDIIQVKKEEPLKNEILDFLSSIVNHHEPKVSGEDGLRAMIIANSVLESIKDTLFE